MNLMTSLENIPLKTSSTPINDDSDDPIVKDILNEFHQEINNQPPPPSPSQLPSQLPSQPNNNEYIINNPIMRKPPPPPTKSSYYDEELLRKSGIIIIIIAFFLSPIYNSLIEKIPSPFSSLLSSYEFYIKLFLIFVVLYLLMIKKLI